ncbi:hypothetical protein [Amycolatopsis sp. lyj-109]|uniref:hypothetical protein n=1 Tax=Amycolatopsis sp. lyj-109 TaxID=2789287 RepID=UPI00397AB27A
MTHVPGTLKVCTRPRGVIVTMMAGRRPRQGDYASGYPGVEVRRETFLVEASRRVEALLMVPLT